jgi:hypothetical protein
MAFKTWLPKRYAEARIGPLQEAIEPCRLPDTLPAAKEFP